MFSKILGELSQGRTRGIAGGTAYSLALAAGVLAGCSATSVDTVEHEASAQTKQEALIEAPPLPSPRDFARGLDLECYKSEGQPPVKELGIRQLNPVLKGVLPNQRIRVDEMLETCLPVSKNHVTPPAEVLRFIRWVDLACYRADADPVDVTVNLSHLNPVLEDLPDENVRLTRLRRFCSPVRKNFSDIEAPVRRLVSHLDFACYEFEQLTPSANRNLILEHLNPVVRAFGYPDQNIELKRANQLCVPVAKNQQPVPDDVQHVVEWVDLLAYHTETLAFPPPAFPLTLQQLNPLFAGVAPTQTLLHDPERLMVPVAKNHVLPPID